jgi:two-component system sensor histidine kinase RegB
VQGETRRGGGGFIQAAAWHDVRQLMLVRNIAIVGQAFVILAVDQGLAVPLPLATLASVTGFLVLFNLGTFWRLQQSWLASEPEVLGQILVDIGALSLLLYFSGGATNPFVGLFLVPLTIAAVSLPWSYTWPVALLTVACYSLLILFHVPLPGLHQSGADSRLLMTSMWVNYTTSAALIVYFVANISSLLRKNERNLAWPRQRDLNNEYLVRMGALAAGAAHELRSPLTTMAVLVDELRQQYDADDRRNLAENLRIMSDQIEACRRILCDLVAYGQGALVIDTRIEPVDKFLHETVAKWQLLRPGIKLAFQWTGVQPAPKISTECGLGHAILNLLNNAADASPQAVEMDCEWDTGELKILIQDRGPGIPSELGDMLGKPFFTTKRDKGTGLGLLLAKMAIDRASGSLKLSNRAAGGVRAEVILPLKISKKREQLAPSNDSAVSAKKLLHVFGGRTLTSGDDAPATVQVSQGGGNA